MGCNFCRPKGWTKKACNICGAGSACYISITISVPNGSDYPYSQTDLCRECWEKYGIAAALDHNAQCRDICGIEGGTG